MNVLERMEAIGAQERIDHFNELQKLPFEDKKVLAISRINEFLWECRRRGLNTHVSVGGLDSITLYMFINYHPNTSTLRKLIPGGHCPGISATYLEDKSIGKIHRAFGIESLRPVRDENGKPYTKQRILQEFGFPVLSKETAAKIELLQNPTERNKTVRHAIITGETGEYGGYRTGTRMQLSKKWLVKFGGYENDNEGVNYGVPDFKVSSKCCYYLKERPCDIWAKDHHSVPFLGLMASEHGRREKSLKVNGCNYFGNTTIRSAPFATFLRQDLLELAQEMDYYYQYEGVKEQILNEGIEAGRLKPGYEMPDSIVPTIYGDIASLLDGELYTTKAQRTGCSMCGFGIHLEKRPHRFDLLKERNPKEWDYWMYHCCLDENGNEFGWAKVLDYIGVEY